MVSASDSRYALVIGNSEYQYASPLKNPKNDSSDIAATLEGLYFETTLLQNATKQQIEVEVEKFLEKLKQEDGVGLFYYAGHGVQLQGDNFLVPVETQAGTDQQIKNQSFNIDEGSPAGSRRRTAGRNPAGDRRHDRPGRGQRRQGIQ